ncbi:hypothetical protein ACH4GE_19365 [Streptomyces tendae]
MGSRFEGRAQHGQGRGAALDRAARFLAAHLGAGRPDADRLAPVR